MPRMPREDAMRQTITIAICVAATLVAVAAFAMAVF